MKQLSVIQSLKQDTFALDYAAAAMYRIREPIGSTRLPFSEISSGKQTRNRDLALRTLTAVFEQYPDPTEVRDPDILKDFLAEQMYRTLAPQKSEQFPFDQRTPYARSYYRDTAERFLENFLLPLAEASQRSQAAFEPTAKNDDPLSQGPRGSTRTIGSSPSTQPIASGTSNVLPESSVPPSASRQATSRSAQSVSKPVRTFPTGASPTSSKQTISSTSDDRPSRSSSSKTQSPRTGENQASPVVPWLLLLIVVLLLVLVFRTF